MRAVLIGLGSIGRRHLANLRAAVPDADITVVRHRRTDEPPPAGADRIVFDRDAALARHPDLVLVCGPTATHADDAVAAANARAHLFVEKPLAADPHEAQAIVEAVARAGTTCTVGYNLRFLGSLRALHAAVTRGDVGRVMHVRAHVGQYLPDWRPGVDYRTTNSARAALGGDVLLELSHELDYVRWLAGDVSEVDAMLARTGDLDIDVDDSAELVLRFTSGALGSVHLDMVERAVVRGARVTGTDASLRWDGIAGTVDRLAADGSITRLHDGDPDRNQMYVALMRHVLACVAGTERPVVDAADAARTVALAFAARRAAHDAVRVVV